MMIAAAVSRSCRLWKPDTMRPVYHPPASNWWNFHDEFNIDNKYHAVVDVEFSLSDLRISLCFEWDSDVLVEREKRKLVMIPILNKWIVLKNKTGIFDKKTIRKRWSFR